MVSIYRDSDFFTFYPYMVYFDGVKQGIRNISNMTINTQITSGGLIKDDSDNPGKVARSKS